MVSGSGISTLVPFKPYSGARVGFIMAGQSNMGDYALVSTDLEAQYKTVYPNVLFYNYSASNGIKFTPMDYSLNPSYQAPVQVGKYALQFYLYPDLATLLGKQISIVHHSQGGTSLASDWLSTSTTNLYAQLVFKTQQFINACISVDGVAPNIPFMVWQQGESDASVLADANAYQVNLTNLINNFRTAIGMPNLPVLICRININFDPTRLYMATVRAAQTAVAGALANVFIVNQDNATMAPDLIHYTNDGYRQIDANIISVAQANALL